jgi:putative endonuclease
VVVSQRLIRPMAEMGRSRPPEAGPCPTDGRRAPLAEKPLLLWKNYLTVLECETVNQKYFTYVLRSEHDGHLYIGHTSDLRKRIREHNKGKVRSTKGRRPLSLVYYEEYEDRTSGRKREIFLKSGQGRLFLKNKLEETAK